MGLPWIQLSVDMPDHPKVLSLGLELGIDRCQAVGHLCVLWTSAGRLAPRGIVSGGHASDVIEEMAGWRGDRGVFVGALMNVGLLDSIDDGYEIHDWADHAGAFVEKFRKDAERKREKRAAQKAAQRPLDVRRTSAGRPQNVRDEIEREIETEIDKKQLPLSANADREQLVLTPVDSTQRSPAQQVFVHWCATMKKRGTAVFDAKRRRAVEARLKDGYSVADLCRAIDGCAITPHNIGQNDKGQRYDDLELICRDAAHVDRFVANASQPPVPNQPEPKRHPEIWRKLKPGEDIYADPYGEDA